MGSIWAKPEAYFWPDNLRKLSGGKHWVEEQGGSGKPNYIKSNTKGIQEGGEIEEVNEGN